MKSSRRSYVLRASLVLAILASASHAFADETDTAVARDSMTRGKAAFEKSDYATARAEFLAAYGVLSQHPPVPLNVLLNLGGASYKLGKFAEAATFYRQYVEHPAASEREKSAVKTWFEKSKSKVGEITLEAPPGASITDKQGSESRDLGRAPLSSPLFLEPGDHVLTARWEGHDEQKMLTVVAGRPDRVKFEGTTGAPVSQPPAKADPVVAPPTDPETSQYAAGRWIVGGVGWGLGAVLLGGGIGFAVAANGKRSTIDELRAQGASCNRGVRCGDLQDAQSSVNTNRIVSTVGIVAGGAVLVGTTLAVFFWPHKKPTPIAGLHLRPSVSPWHLGIQGDF